MLGLRHAVVISVAVMSPAASIFFNTIPQAGLVGAAIPLCYVIGFVVALLVANQYSELSRELPSSGSAYTYVRTGLNAHWGFLTGWLGLAAVAVGAPYSFVLMSANIQVLVLRWSGLNVSWIIWFVLAVGIVFALCYTGIRQSLQVDMTLLVFEMGICLILAALIFFHVGSQGGLSLAPFSVNQVPKGGDLTVGIILAVLSFIGFETAATLGEETANPHRNIPRAVFGSMLVVGIFYILIAYTATIGYGIQNMASGYANDPAPFDTIGRHFSGSLFASIIDLAGTLSFFSAALAIINGGARIIYTVGRDGLLPRWTALAHRTHHTPIGAITLLCLFALICGIPLGLFLTPITAFSFLGTLDALLILPIYILVNIACLRFFRQQRRSQFSLLRHGLMPIVSTILMAAIFVAAFIAPGPAPLSFVPIVVGVWLLIGAALIIFMRKQLVQGE
ncbi:amino acid permease [Dictyobacter vulcani]|uniref:Amino acid permease n=1 Tax=Dictyobacter vulcani TaxID=2607529 RepID=A0A5J4KWS0_9CHLR|nr:APC family permease [Dictyobacter vulcani]GER90579.1 amino acid permease [Dictyobacter vulcani]